MRDLRDIGITPGRKVRRHARATMDRDGNVTIVEWEDPPSEPDPADGDAVIDSLIAERPELGRTELTDEDCAKLRSLGVDLAPEEEARAIRGMAKILKKAE